MRHCDLLSGAGRLQRAATDLSDQWRDAKEAWTDENARKFEEEFLLPLSPLLKQVFVAVRRLTEVLEQAEAECSDPDATADC